MNYTRIVSTLAVILGLSTTLTTQAQGWPANYDGVMLQGFYWDSYDDTQWAKLEAQADELSRFFQLIWVPQSGNCNTTGKKMGYTPIYYFNHNSSFGTERQLRSMIQTFKDKGTGIIADVVINHRDNLGRDGSWVDYPAETYKGETYQMLPSDICSDDDGGATLSWAKGRGISLSANKDTGEDWPGCRDIDHQSANVQRCVKAYLDFLLNDLGYTGFRYDMVKGFYASYIGEYNMSAKPAFSVGECWDGTTAIRSWISNSKGYVSSSPTSAAFDFQFRYRVRDAINAADWSILASQDMVLKDSYYQRYAVTFVENHDTEKRAHDDQDPILHDTLQANAFLLAMPGTPCVFLKHWQAYKPQIKAMIEARRLAGITNTSTYTQKGSTANYYQVAVKGSRGELMAVVGKRDKVSSTLPAVSGTYVELLSGPGYRYLLSRTANTVWMDLPSGEYDQEQDVRLTAVCTKSTAPVVYTTDGSDPTPQSPQVKSGSTVCISGPCTLKAGLLVDGNVIGIAERHYVVKPFAPHTATIYVCNESLWTTMNFYIWDNANKQLNGNWPGRRITTRKAIDGKVWYYQTIDIPTRDYSVSLVCSGASGSPQTVDWNGIRNDKYLLITRDTQDGKYIIEDVTREHTTAIQHIMADDEEGDATRRPTLRGVFNLQGQRVAPDNPSSPAFRIVDGRKVFFPKR